MKKESQEYKVLKFISDYIKTNSRAPTIVEIAAALEFKSNNSAVKHIDKLVEKNYISKIPAISRSIKITAKGMRALGAAK